MVCPPPPAHHASVSFFHDYLCSSVLSLVAACFLVCSVVYWSMPLPLLLLCEWPCSVLLREALSQGRRGRRVLGLGRPSGRFAIARSASQVTAPRWVTPTPRTRLARARGVPIPPRARRDRPVQKHRAFCRDDYELNTNDRRWRRMRSAAAVAAAAIASGGANGGCPCPLHVGLAHRSPATRRLGKMTTRPPMTEESGGRWARSAVGIRGAAGGQGPERRRRQRRVVYGELLEI